jgi:hypothetical protein
VLYRTRRRTTRYVLRIASASSAATLIGFTACFSGELAPVGDAGDQSHEEAGYGSSGSSSGPSGSAPSGSSGSGSSGSSSGYCCGSSAGSSASSSSGSASGGYVGVDASSSGWPFDAGDDPVEDGDTGSLDPEANPDAPPDSTFLPEGG